MRVTHFSKFPQIISQNARILVAPLDWGLGHATRCIPLIEQLIDIYNAKITVAASGAQQSIISEAFPNITFHTPPSYTIKYDKNRAATVARLVVSVPGILQTIRSENAWLNSLLEQESFDAIISDNRYGMAHKTIPSFLLTHQLLVKTAFGNWANSLLQRHLYKLIDKFTECWVPDYEHEPSLAGELSHPVIMPGIPVRYLGPLSRLTSVLSTDSTQLLFILSGPEPQRTLLEERVIQQWQENPGESIVLVRGLPLENSCSIQLTNGKIFNHLSATALSQEVANAGTILCRSGYSSIMDLVPLKKKIFMVATPGQSEQEYLAKFLDGQGLIKSIDQKSLRLENLLPKKSQHII